MKKYALISKSQCCINWEKSFSYEKYMDDEGNIYHPDWGEWSKDDNASYMYLSGERDVEDEGIEPLPEKYTVVYGGTGERYGLNDKNEAKQMLWDFHSDDYRYEIYTVQEALEELYRNDMLQLGYAEFYRDGILNAFENEEDPSFFIADNDDFLGYVRTVSSFRSRNYVLSEIAELDG